MKLWQREIENCGHECPEWFPNSSGWRWCKRAKKGDRSKDGEGMPDWCPLSEAPVPIKVTISPGMRMSREEVRATSLRVSGVQLTWDAMMADDNRDG